MLQVDLCAAVVCAPVTCKSAPVCAHGVCNYVNLPDTTMCDDGSSLTVNDQCIAGTCKGTILD